jgi:hypothetical protein
MFLDEVTPYIQEGKQTNVRLWESQQPYIVQDHNWDSLNIKLSGITVMNILGTSYNNLLYEVVSIILGIGVTICTAVVVVRCNSRW